MKDMTPRERATREAALIAQLQAAQQEAWVLGLPVTYRGIERGLKAIGWEIAAHRTGPGRSHNEQMARAFKAVATGE